MRPVVLLGGWLCLWAGTPPRWFPGAELLVVVGLVAFLALATGPRAGLQTWLLGALHTWALSSSLVHEFFVGWVPIGLVGGLYWLLAGAGHRRLVARGVPAPLAGGLAVAACFWLRAHMVEIPYPHGQPAHAFYLWPSVLGPVRWGGEVLANVLLGALAGAILDLGRCWRVGVPAPRRAGWGAGIVTAVAAAAVALPPAGAPGIGDDRRIAVAAVEPGGPPGFQLDREQLLALEQRLLEGAHEAAGRDVEDPPELVLWPESAHRGLLHLDRSGPRAWDHGGMTFRLARGVRMLAGALAVREGDVVRPVAVLLDEYGRYLDHQEKLVRVPGGERVPFGDVLPFLRAWGSSLGIPHFTPGDWRPPVALADGTRIGGLLCYETCFPAIAARHVDEGARLLAVLTNEAWYHGGSELDQMDAMVVMRAVETGTPVVRCTLDGNTMAAAADGRIVGRLAGGVVEEGGRGRILRVEMAAGPGGLRPMAWLPPVLPWLLLLAGVAAFLPPWGRRG